MGGTKRVLMLGDVVGEAGIAALEKRLPALIRATGADFVVANGENATGGFGIAAPELERILDAGVDVVTSGNHVWEKKGYAELLESEERLVRPANYPEGAPGRGSVLVEKAGVRWFVCNLQGRERMRAIDCPFRAGERLASDGAEAGAVVLVDFHAESSDEKEALCFHLDGTVAAVVGTHTHVQTADARVSAKGTACLTDLGMCGPVDSVIGMRVDTCVRRSVSQMPLKMEVAEGAATIRGALVEIDPETRLAVSIETVKD
ncbi:MAG: TIGR00282 family metallophosphoesterase [Spirochaetales bacterium]|nr:TIGR00282 family metallophosphoesterase [Spirochaetales bacterium]